MIALRALEERDLEGMYEWLQDEEIVKQFQFGRISKIEALEFIERSRCAEKHLHLAISDRKSDEYLGTISLKNIDYIDRNAEYAICLRKKAMGQGVAKEATKAILQKGFYEMNLERIYLNVLQTNIRAIKFYEKFGFHLEGRFAKHRIVEGKLVDLLWYRMLKEEFSN